VVGGGIGGLVTAARLKQLGLRVTLLEQGDQVRGGRIKAHQGP
jgi:phytoene dehydrogenase-like protein